MKDWVIDMAAEKLTITNLNKIFVNANGTEVQALKDIQLTVHEKELCMLVGPSGCGKSTLLNIVGGLETATSGEICVDGHHVTGPGADRGMVFQGYSLFPWLTVRENIQFGLRVKGLPKSRQKEIADKFIELVGLKDFADALPKTLSGGMKQRVAIARTLANEPSLLLMDEPFGALDAQTRLIMQELLVDIRQKMETTILFITHDIDEAVFLSNKIYVMSARPGKVIKEVNVYLPHKRNLELKDSPEFIEIRKGINDLLYSANSEAEDE